ncbi:hypothetical protein QBC46DRAFT_68432 [Diplogelasinospora grovesii]|uniref:Uncharacterized protein n=1 Tax=Diplogelasinospora grovesii TaxID=303347 RepID=A0AAN6S038_9PEZI|nr:hypothetical protein QBC46DRAFT_68432 [Diplogelasinospora grovesii]
MAETGHHGGKDNPPFEQCPLPIALQICGESREYTLRHYVPMMDRGPIGRLFYFSPNRDFLCTSDMYIWHLSIQKDLSLIRNYGPQLYRIQNVLDNGHRWGQTRVTFDNRWNSKCFFDTFRGIKHVRILLGQNKPEDPPMRPEEYQARADELAQRDAAFFIKHNRNLCGTMEYVDPKGTVYRRISLGE